MSAIAAAVGTGATAAAQAVVERALGAMRELGDDRESAAPAGADRIGIALGAATHDWERGLRAGARVHAHGAVTVAADATLYHRADLRRALGLAPEGDSGDAELVARAWERWGLDAFARLEGDFAVVLWDAVALRLVAARSFAGHRPLYLARAGASIRVATTVDALLADETVPRGLDLGAVAIAASGLWGHAPQTAYAAVEEVAGGRVVTWDATAGLRHAEAWRAPEDVLRGRPSRDAGAEELRALLAGAVRERAAPHGTTALSLSGGWDSTSVGGAAQLAFGGGAAARLRPVSISYPAGDPGREDELIGETVAHWHTATRWIDVDSITLLPDLAGECAARELPFAHTYEHWNRALSRAARADGARVMLDGVGGDQLFQVSDIVLADLFARGRWGTLAREWRRRGGWAGGRGARELWRWAVRPALPRALPSLLARARGLPAPPDYLDRHAPRWFHRGFLERSGALARDAAAAPALPRHDHALREMHAYLRHAFFSRITGALHRFALTEGVELRSPLLDDRVVRFALRRPWHERAEGGETKVLLRHAMRGLVPDRVLAPRPARTGVTSAYFLRQLRGPARPAIESALRDPVLASLGIADARGMRQAWEHVLRQDDDETAVRLLFTLQADLWTRAHLAREGRA